MQAIKCWIFNVNNIFLLIYTAQKMKGTLEKS